MTFAFHRPPDLDAALGALAEEGALPIAGGTALVPRLRRREVTPRLLVSISGLSELRDIRPHGGTIALGATATLAEVARSREVAEGAPLLAELCSRVRSPQIRNAATLGGSILSGPSFAEPALALLALGAKARLRSLGEQREIAVEDLLTGEAAVQSGELIVGVVVPVAGASARVGIRTGVYRVARREAIEPPLVAAATWLRLGADGAAEDVRACLGVATSRPVRLRQVEEALRGKVVSTEAARRAAADAVAEIPLRPDVRAGEGYRRKVIPVAVARSVEAALGRGR